MVLNKILEAKRARLEAARRGAPLADLKARCRDAAPTVPFRPALKRTEGSLALIAELKKASPSKGLIRPDFDPPEFARIYEGHGAAAISVLTEEDFFQGSLEYLRQVRKAVKIPLLRKDFLTDPYQVYEARANGADAVLLIATVLETSLMADLAAQAAELGLDALVEVHSGPELERALAAGLRLIGINNRNLDTLKIRLDTTLALAADTPDDALVVTESGIGTRADVERLMHSRVSAMLVGTAIMASTDIGRKIDELLGR